ncbi:adenylate/guanylate cyclase domain-containing protein [Ancylothrix sp. C2]|uniref:CHASE2 domain-containing protein n=1 Tax=Ancylothrix sp. D3o TaxID=2953691 RepID=UPI0021BA905A|nr:adenylate/guanylate cyclase domain-containing protein [Ancylothrix sp. D3o]MCT7952522.1 adenylate/guanylate cyclase domain-containing protein [Ancylothrix sp. D3o]
MVVKTGLQRIQSFLTGNYPWLPGAMAAVVSVSIAGLGYWKQPENLAYNTFYQLRPQLKWDERIAVIAIDQASLQEYGQFPWPRTRYAQLLQALEKTPPAAIGFDILWIAPSANDEELASALAANNRSVLARAWDKQGKSLQVLPKLASAAAGVGHILHQPDEDGISRNSTIWVNTPQISIPGLSAAMLQVYNANNPGKTVGIPAARKAEKYQNIWINWPSKTEYLTTYSFADIAEGRINPDLTGKLVLVGATATGMDEMRTPLNQKPPTSGVYLYAAVIDNLLNQRLLKPSDHWFDLLILLMAGPVTSWFLFERKLKERIFIGLMLPPAWFTIVFAAFCWGNLWFPVAAPVATILLTLLFVQVREQYEKQQLMSLFAQHVAPEMAEVIWERKDEIFENGELEAQELTATVLFMDIRSFTSISENMKPRDLLNWLNQYFDVMARCIMEHGGVIDKYIGDAIMAVFGIPFPQGQVENIKGDATAAIAASMAMHERLKELNKRFEEEGKPVIKFGIGIHTGTVVAGTVGGAERLSYSVVGDTVNVAARLEAMTKNLTADKQFKILLTDRTYSYVSDRYLAEEVGAIQLRGKADETTVYTIVGEVNATEAGAG